MATDLPFTGSDAVELRLRMLESQRDRHMSRLREHIAVLKDREHRGALMKDAVGDLLHAWRPAETVMNALKPGKGVLPMLVNFAAMRGSFKRRVFWSALALVAPVLLKRVDMKKVVGLVAGAFNSAGRNGHSEHAPVQEEEDFTEPWQ